jgi:hypothetical protein
VAHERRRRPRIERHRKGEAMIGVGVLALAAAFIGRDSWSYSTLVVMLGAVFLVAGTVLNRRYVHDLFVNRGPLRRREDSEQGTELVGAVPRAQEVERPLPGGVTDAPRPGWPQAERRKAPREGDRAGQQSGTPDNPRPPNH